jgi:nucleotidyltransferase/DNA polymerase involved in DNA repair
MRIACIHVPQFALQCATRLDPSLRGVPLAIVSGGDPAASERALRAPIVVACSRAAWSVGVRLGMTAPAARARSATLAVVPLATAIERETIRAIGDALGAIADTVDLGAHIGAAGAHYALYASVPARTRGHVFGERTLAILDELGITARVGIADDRFTAWVAASFAGDGERAVVSVPRGGAAAYLAPRPLSLLAIAPEVQHMLEALGVTTLGEFAKLPAPSIARPFEADYQALARGEGGTAIRAYHVDTAIREEAVVTAGHVLDAPGVLSGVAAVALVARRVALRLAGRGRAAQRLEVRAGELHFPIELDRPLAEADELARVVAPVLASQPVGKTWRLTVVVAREEQAGGETFEVVAEGSQPIAVQGLQSISATRAAEPVAIDPLAIVLATSGSAELHAWSLQAPDARSLRREAHRRTRRGKRRARTEAFQPRLFDRRNP